VSCAETAEPIDLPFGCVDLSVLQEAQVQLYSPGGANVPSPVGTLSLPGKYDCPAAAMQSYVKLL